MRDTCISDIRDCRVLELGMGVLVKIRTLEARLTGRKE